MSEINVVPYIDVMLVLLVIFMITAPLLSQGVKVDLPRVASEPLPPSEREPLIVTVDREGRVFVNYGEDQDTPIGDETLMARVAALLRNQPDIPVLVKGDEGTAYGAVVRVMSLLQGAGAEGIGLMTDPPPPEPR